MKPINIFRIIFCLMLTCCFSCTKYLEKKSNAALVVPKSVDDLQALLDDNAIMNVSTPGFGETSADNYFLLTTTYNALPVYQQQGYTWQLQTYAFGNDWNLGYNAIYNANYCLDELGKAAVTAQNQPSWNNVKGSALFFRAYYFLGLTWDYAKAYDEASASSDLGIVLRLGSDFNVPSVRASVRACYEQVIKDLTAANAYLPDNAQNRMRPSKTASYAVLARAYLSMRKYDSAYKYSDMALALHKDLLDFNSSEVSPAAGVPFKQYNKEILFYSTEDGDLPTKAVSRALIDTAVYNSYDKNDLRKKVYFGVKLGYHNFKGSYATNGSSYFSGIATDELYLVRAESAARLNRVTDAMNDLNTLLVNRWVTGTFTPLAAANAADALNKVLVERRKELMMRGLRWIDIKRFNKEGANLTLTRVEAGQTFTLPPNDSRYALALPSDIISEAGIPQN